MDLLPTKTISERGRAIDFTQREPQNCLSIQPEFMMQPRAKLPF